MIVFNAIHPSTSRSRTTATITRGGNASSIYEKAYVITG
jgi:hypothetical protein